MSDTARRIGRAVRRFLEVRGDLAWLVGRSLKDLLTLDLKRVPVLNEQVRLQIRFTGVDALLLVVSVGMGLGAVTVIQAFSQLSALGAEQYLGPLLVLIIIRELGPLLAAILVIGRSGTAIAAELGYMQLHGEVDALESFDVNPHQYLLLPRALGVIISLFGLLCCFDAAALAGGFLIAKFKFGLPLGAFLNAIAGTLTNTDLGLTLVKGFLFGGSIAYHAAYCGLTVKRSSTEIPQAVTRAVVASLGVIFVFDGLLAALVYL
jgi:phospholipid/cholesterol/gamma-HCH transport system permease protein